MSDNPFGFNFDAFKDSKSDVDQPVAVITSDMIRKAMEDLREQDNKRMRREAERARRVDEWLLSIPEHARRHLFVQQYAQSVIGGVILHPRTGREIADYISRIIAMTPEEADADSKALLEHLAENYDMFGNPL